MQILFYVKQHHPYQDNHQKLLIIHVTQGLLFPHVVCKARLSHLKPAVLRMPATTPTATAPAGENDKFAAEPIATPPARVAFWIWTMLNLPLRAAEEAKAAIAAPNSARMVFMTHRNCLWPPPAACKMAAGSDAKAPLKLGCTARTHSQTFSSQQDVSYRQQETGLQANTNAESWSGNSKGLQTDCANCCCQFLLPEGPLLKHKAARSRAIEISRALTQNSHKKMVPIIAVISEVYEPPFLWWSDPEPAGDNTRLAARP